MDKNDQVLVLKKDLVIPKGTVLRNIDGMTSSFTNGNYETIFGLTADSFGRLIYSIDDDDADLDEWFEQRKGEK